MSSIFGRSGRPFPEPQQGEAEGRREPAAPGGSPARKSNQAAKPQGAAPPAAAAALAHARPQPYSRQSLTHVPAVPEKTAETAAKEPTAPPIARSVSAPPLTAPQVGTSRPAAQALATFAAGQGPFAELRPQARVTMQALFSLLAHPEGLKLYFFAHPRVRTFFASQTLADAHNFVTARKEQRAAKQLSEHKDLLQAMLQQKPAELEAALLPVPPATRAGAAAPPAFKVLDLKRALMAAQLKSSAASKVAGPAAVHGGTRLRLSAAGDQLLLEPSQGFGYRAPAAEDVRVLAQFYANVLRAGADGKSLPPCVALPLPADAQVGQVAAHEINAGLTALAAAINAALKEPAERPV